MRHTAARKRFHGFLRPILQRRTQFRLTPDSRDVKCKHYLLDYNVCREVYMDLANPLVMLLEAFPRHTSQRSFFFVAFHKPEGILLRFMASPEEKLSS